MAAFIQMLKSMGVEIDESKVQICSFEDEYTEEELEEMEEFECLPDIPKYDNPLVPDIVGKNIHTVFVKEEKYNDIDGFVIGFNEEAKSFEVELQNGETKLFKSRNLRNLVYLPQYVKNKLRLLREDPGHLNINRSQEIWNFFDFENHSDPAWQELIIKKLCNWGTQCYVKYKDRRTFKKVMNWMEFLLDKSRDFPNVQITIKLGMVSFGFMNGHMADKRVKDILKPLLKKHYGTLPIIALTIFQNGVWRDNEEKLLEIYLDTMKIIDSQNYDACCDAHTFYHFAIQSFYTCENIHSIVHVPNILKKLYKKIENWDSEHADLCRAQILYSQNNFPEALVYAKKAEAAFSLKNTLETRLGRNNDHFLCLYGILFNCYFQMGDPQGAKKYVQKMKKIKKDPTLMRRERLFKNLCKYSKLKDTTHLDPEIQNELKKLEQRKKKYKKRAENIENFSNFKPIKKCSFYRCENKESRSGEYKACSLCKKVYYCSKQCQKSHWKSDHKHTCTGYTKKNKKKN